MPETVHIPGGLLSAGFFLVGSLFIAMAYFFFWKGLKDEEQILSTMEIIFFVTGLSWIFNRLNGYMVISYYYFLAVYLILTAINCIVSLVRWKNHRSTLSLSEMISFERKDHAIAIVAFGLVLVSLIPIKEASFFLFSASLLALILAFTPVWRGIRRYALKPDPHPWLVWTTGWCFITAGVFVECFPENNQWRPLYLLHPLTNVVLYGSVWILSRNPHRKRI